MPRTVIYDLKGGFGSLKRFNELYELESEAQGRGGVWTGPTVISTAPPIHPSPYLASLSIDGIPARPSISTVKYWSDFSHLFYHPRSIVQLNNYSLGSSIQPFENYTSGDELFDGLDKEHDLLDRDLRLWVEECDQMQGVQVFTGCDDAWGGFASRYVERLRDEYGKVGIWVWGIDGGEGEGRKDKKLLKTTNAARALHDLSMHASQYVPISNIPPHLPEYVSLNRLSEWHTSALLATVIESVALPCRSREDGRKRTTFNDFEAALNTNGNQRIAQLTFSVLDPQLLKDKLKQDSDPSHGDLRAGNSQYSHEPVREDSQRARDVAETTLDVDLLPGEMNDTRLSLKRLKKAPHVFGRVESLRGPFAVHAVETQYNDDDYSRKRRRLQNLPILERYQSSLAFEILDTFPEIFRDVSKSGLVAIHASLSTSSIVSTRVKGLQRVVARTVGLGEREALSNGLGEIAEAYEEGWSSGSDDDSDD
ncbi:mtDNA inheritance, partitioning of the mitochondrial organelle [Xylographa soralifera]|nr:mtDNA inheritance, partitioning of the mitochondrial organelle [Xylographa soralifera]